MCVSFVVFCTFVHVLTNLNLQEIISNPERITSMVNPLHAKFFRVNINMYLYFISFLRTNKTQVVEIPPWIRQGPAYTT